MISNLNRNFTGSASGYDCCMVYVQYVMEESNGSAIQASELRSVIRVSTEESTYTKSRLRIKKHKRTIATFGTVDPGTM